MNSTDSSPSVRVVALIPARYHSTRLPGKPLLEIAGRAMILRVLDCAAAARNIARTIVATDDRRIFEVAQEAGYEAVMTRADHASGSDRLAEAAAALADAEVIANLQGDEPMIAPATIERAVDALLTDDEAQVATTSEAITDAADVLNPDAVKVVTDERGRALYFSRSPIPYPREAARRHGSLRAALESEPELLSLFRKHTGLYVYRRSFLLEYAAWPQSVLERAESLEQLRMLERGAKIRVVAAASPSIGVDTWADLERVRAIFAGSQLDA